MSICLASLNRQIATSSSFGSKRPFLSLHVCSGAWTSWGHALECPLRFGSPRPATSSHSTTFSGSSFSQNFFLALKTFCIKNPWSFFSSANVPRNKVKRSQGRIHGVAGRTCPQHRGAGLGPAWAPGHRLPSLWSTVFTPKTLHSALCCHKLV